MSSKWATNLIIQIDFICNFVSILSQFWLTSLDLTWTSLFQTFLPEVVDSITDLMSEEVMCKMVSLEDKIIEKDLSKY